MPRLVGVEAGSQENIFIPGALYGCRWCGRDLEEPDCPNGCGHAWIVRFHAQRDEG